MVAFANKSGRVRLDQWQLREDEDGLSVFAKVAAPPPSVVLAAIQQRKKGSLGVYVLRTEDVWALGLRFVASEGGTGVPLVDSIHFEIRLSLFREIGFSFRREQKREFFNTSISPQLQAIARLFPL